MANNAPYNSIDPRASIESIKLGASYGANRSAHNGKQPMSNNFVNRSI